MKQHDNVTAAKPRHKDAVDVLLTPTPTDDPPAASAVASRESTSWHEWIATEAYSRAEPRGFAAGLELDDWLAAEAAVKACGAQLR